MQSHQSGQPQKQAAIQLIDRVVESLVAARPGRYALYLVRPDAATLLAESERYRSLCRQAKRALILTGWGDAEPLVADLPHAQARRQSQARCSWVTVVLDHDLAMASVARAHPDGGPTDGFFTSDPVAARRIVGAIEACAADPQTELVAV